MKTMTCKQLGGPCDVAHEGGSADEIIKAQERHLMDVVAQGDSSHESALADMKGRRRNPLKGMGWYKKVKSDYAASPDL